MMSTKAKTQEGVDECKNFIKDVQLKTALWNREDPDYNLREILDGYWEELSTKYGMSVEATKTKWRGLRDSFRKNLRREMAFRKAYPNRKLVQRWRYFVPLMFLKSQLIPTLERASKPMAIPKSFFFQPKIEADDENSLTGDVLEATFDEQENYNLPMEEEDTTIFIVDPPEHGPMSDEPASNTNTNTDKDQKPSAVLSELLKSFQKDIIELEKQKSNMLNLDATDDDVLFLHSLLPYFRSLDMKKKLILRTKIQQIVCDHLTDSEKEPTVNYRFPKKTKPAKKS